MPHATTAVAVAGAAILAPWVHAQPAPSWNRKAEAISALLVPVSGTLYDVSCYATLHAADLGQPVNLSTVLEIRINGTTVYAQPVSMTGNPADTDPCSGLPCAGEPCLCTPPPVVCECGPVVISAGTTAPLAPGDEITIILYPAPGAAPEPDTSDDSVTVVFQGETLLWNRSVESIELVPVAAPDSFFDIFVDIDVDVRNQGALDLSGRLDLLVNGTAAATAPYDLTGIAWGTCAPAVCDGPCTSPGGGTCTTDPLLGCLCALPRATLVFPSVELTPGDEITVILYPAPGALPELPGLDGDDALALPPCPWDCGDASLTIDIVDLLALLSQWGRPDSACDFDGGGVAVTDLLKLLANWGPCFPK